MVFITILFLSIFSLGINVDLASADENKIKIWLTANKQGYFGGTLDTFGSTGPFTIKPIKNIKSADGTWGTALPGGPWPFYLTGQLDNPKKAGEVEVYVYGVPAREYVVNIVPAAKVPAITLFGFVLALLSLFGLAAVAMRKMYKR